MCGRGGGGGNNLSQTRNLILLGNWFCSICSGSSDEWMKLECIGKPGNCLQSTDRKLSISSCVKNDENQLWKLEKDGKLVSHSSYGSARHCADPDSLRLSDCARSSNWTCLPFALKTDQNNSYLGVADSGSGDDGHVDLNLIKEDRSDSYMRAMWRRFGDPTRTICGGKISVDNTKNQSELFKEFLKYIPP